jgi:hypothetical protein
MAPIAEFASGTVIQCRIDAPVADYATWSVIGPVTGMRSGPLDPTLPCQSADDFANQDPAHLRLSTCLRMRAEQPGLYLLSATVMLRGQHSLDRARMVIRVVPAPAAAAPSTAPRNQRLIAALRLPAMEAEQTHEVDLSASFGEHGLLPQSRAFERVVHRLAPGEEFVSAAFHARSAANASAVQLVYVPQSRVVRANFTLRSGPVVDRWRGWVSGTVAVRVRRQEPAREVELPQADLAVPGQARLALPQGINATSARILLRRPETSVLVEMAPGDTASLDDARVTARIEDGALLLQAEPE